MKNKFSVSLAILFLFVGCNFHTKKELPASVEEFRLLPLDSGVVYYQHKLPFDTLYHLTGEKALDDTLSQYSFLFIKDNLLILNNWVWNSETHISRQFSHYALSSMQLLNQVDDTLSHLDIIITPDTALVCYLWDTYNLRLYKYYKSGERELDSALSIKPHSQISSINDIGNHIFVCLKDSSIIRTTNKEDSIGEKKIYDLPMRPKWGRLIVNTAKNRMVFAYTYFHLFHVMDLDAKTVKTIDFNNGNHYYDHEFEHAMDAPNPNIAYYCDAFAGENYFYLLYLGHTSEEFINNANKGWKWSKSKKNYVKTDAYQQSFSNIVEQYDWNGNPVAKYLLEGNSGDFVVDEKNQRFYLLAAECYDYFMQIPICDKYLMVYPFPAVYLNDSTQ
jgi:hypothetical protein